VDAIQISGQGPVASFYQHNNEPLGCIKGGKFLTRVLVSQEGLCSMEFINHTMSTGAPELGVAVAFCHVP